MRTDADRPWLAAYPDDVPADVPRPDASLPQLLARAVDRFAERPALDFLGAATSYRQLGAAVERAAGLLHALGVRAGDRVALVLPNCPQHVVAFHAALRLGAVVVEHNPLYTADELGVQFADHGADVAVCWSTVAPVVAGLGVGTVLSVDLARDLPWRSRLALRLPLPAARAARAGLGPARVPGTRRWAREFAAAPPLPDGVPVPAVGDVALLQYTGTPKGAMLTHANLVANAVQGRAWMPGLRDGAETVLAVLPMFHAYGLTLCLNFSLIIGARMALLPRFDVDQAVATIRRVPPTFLPGVPPVYARLAEQARAGRVDLTSVRYALSGAMALPAELVDQWEELTGGLLVEGYGLSEASPIVLGNPAATNRRPGTVGVPFPSTRMRVVDPDDPAVDVAEGSAGELLVAGPQVFAGYWNRPDDTAQVLLPGGWLRTGDVVQVEPGGFVRIVDRIKELVVTGGFNVYPSEVEDVLRRHPDVADAGVVGLPDPDRGERVTAAVVPDPGAAPDEAALRAFCREHLAGYKVPTRIVVVDDLPRSTLGKVLRRRLRDELVSRAAAGS